MEFRKQQIRPRMSVCGCLSYQFIHEQEFSTEHRTEELQYTLQAKGMKIRKRLKPGVMTGGLQSQALPDNFLI